MVGTLVLLCVGFVLGLTLESRVEQWLREAFAASGMNDSGGFLVQNTLGAASEDALPEMRKDFRGQEILTCIENGLREDDTKRVLPQFRCTAEPRAIGSNRARKSSKPARPYI